jgi:hypothetical protein
MGFPKDWIPQVVEKQLEQISSFFFFLSIYLFDAIDYTDHESSKKMSLLVILH